MKEISRQQLAKPFMWTIIVCGVAAVAFSIHCLWAERPSASYFALFLITLTLGSRINIKLPKITSGVTLSDTFIFLCLLLFGGPAAVVLSGGEGFLSSMRFSKKTFTRTFNGAVMALSTFVTAYCLKCAYGSLSALMHPGLSSQLVVAVSLMALLQFILNSSSVAVAEALRMNAPVWKTWKQHYLWTSSTYFAGGSGALLTALSIERTGFAAFLVITPIIATVYFTYQTYVKNIEASAAQAEQAKRHVVELRQSEERFRSAFDNAPIGMALVAPDGRWLQVNDSLCRSLGYGEAELLATNFQALTDPAQLAEILTNIGRLLEGKLGTYLAEVKFSHKHGREVWAIVGMSLARALEDGSPRLIFQVQDITDRKMAEQQLLHEALHDALTGLPNRTMFMQHLRATLRRSQAEHGRLFAVLFLDLDRFKIINDSLGHLIGDKLLMEITRRLRRSVRDHDLVARLGGDEFTVLLDGIKDAGEAVAVAERIQAEVSAPCVVDGHDAYTTVSIGIALSNLGYDEPAALLRDADTAMYRAKLAGKARHVVFDRTMHDNVLARLKLEGDLRKAIERREFLVFYQPIVSLRTRRLEGFEALVRWSHPERGLVPPAEFIPIAEETGAIVEIGQWVLEESLRQTREWQERFAPDRPLKISVNLSGRQFANAHLLEQVLDALHRTGLDPRQLELELTESTVMENVDAAIHTFRQLRTLGVQLSVDDFGTGYSSLAYLHRLPLDTLKIDRSFVTLMAENRENAEIVRTIITLAKSLGLDVIAEGVETEEQVEQLRRLECENGQGYLFSKPVAAAEAARLITELEQARPAFQRLTEQSCGEITEPPASKYTM